MSSFYVLTHPSEFTRKFPPQEFTEKSIIDKRFKENTTAAALSYNLLLPFLNRVNKSIETHIDAANDVTKEEFIQITKDASIQSTIAFADVTARVAVQTGIACALIAAKKPLADSVVYSWDMYPRLHRKYFGDLLQKLYLPRFVASLLGPETKAADLAVFQTKVTPAVAFEDSFKRHAVYTTADIVVDAARAVLESKVKTILSRFSTHAVVLLSRASGAAGGRAAAGDVGEYWGEFAGAFVGPFVAAKIIFAVKRSPSKKNQ